MTWTKYTAISKRTSSLKDCNDQNAELRTQDSELSRSGRFWVLYSSRPWAAFILLRKVYATLKH